MLWIYRFHSLEGEWGRTNLSVLCRANLESHTSNKPQSYAKITSNSDGSDKIMLPLFELHVALNIISVVSPFTSIA